MDWDLHYPPVPDRAGADMKFFDWMLGKRHSKNRLSSLSWPAANVSEIFEQGMDTKYVITDEGLQALVEGKLCCEKLPDASAFLVNYDAIIWDPSKRKVIFCWKYTPLMELELPDIMPGNTITISNLLGKLPLTMHK